MTPLAKTWQTFTATPHRVMFFAGAVQGIATLLWWLIDLMGRFGEFYQPFRWTLPPVWAHAYLMIYGFFPFFIFGFLFTVYPRWMNGREIPARRYVPAFLFLSAGVLLFYLGLITLKAVLVTGVLFMLIGWGIALYALLVVFFTTLHPDKRHPAVTSIALGIGWLGICAYLNWLLTDNPFMLELSRIGGIWFFLLPVFVTVSHLMIPIFSSVVLEKFNFARRYWVLWGLLSAIAGHGLLELLGSRSYLWIADLPLLCFSFYLTWQWGFFKSFKVRLLAVLHIGFAWLSLAGFLYFIQSFVLFVSEKRFYILSLAPLHALAIGFFASMVLGMASRVTLGHSGRPLVADRTTWFLFLSFQVAALSRILADILINAGINGAAWYLIAGGLWLASFIPWTVKYAPVYWRPRADGKPG